MNPLLYLHPTWTYLIEHPWLLLVAVAAGNVVAGVAFTLGRRDKIRGAR